MSALAETIRLLGQAHGFSDEELAANRQGALHQRQTARARSLVGFLVPMIIGDLLLVGGLLGAYLFHAELREPISRVDENATYAIAGVGIILGGLFTVVAVSALSRRKRRLAAYAKGVEVVERAAVTRAVDGGASGLSVSGRSFAVSSATLGLITHGARYRLYCVGEELLSLEPIVTR